MAYSAHRIIVFGEDTCNVSNFFTDRYIVGFGNSNSVPLWISFMQKYIPYQIDVEFIFPNSIKELEEATKRCIYSAGMLLIEAEYQNNTSTYPIAITS